MQSLRPTSPRTLYDQLDACRKLNASNRETIRELNERLSELAPRALAAESSLTSCRGGNVRRDAEIAALQRQLNEMEFRLADLGRQLETQKRLAQAEKMRAAAYAEQLATRQERLGGFWPRTVLPLQVRTRRNAYPNPPRRR